MKYPIGIQDFRRLREEGYVYVDKTPYIHRIINQGNSPKEKIAVGINFSSREKKVTEWDVETW